MEDLLCRCREISGFDESVVKVVVQTFLEQISLDLVAGKQVDLGDNFGVFVVKFRSGKVQDGSPRTPRTAHYKVFFRENNGLKKRLTLQKSLDERQ